jgi:hypothetical protein
MCFLNLSPFLETLRIKFNSLSTNIIFLLKRANSMSHT